jgi:putative lipoic acid-binding regulatory protein
MALTKISRGLLNTGISDSSDATAITIDSSENVGIGTTSPTDVLTVAGNITVSDGSPEVTFQTGASHYNWQIAAQENTNSAFEIAVGSQDADASNDTFSPLVTVLQSGNVELGGALTVDGFGDSTGHYISLRSGYSPDESGGTGFQATDHSGAHPDGLGAYGHDGITFYTAQSERMRIDSSGEIHVNTTATINSGQFEVLAQANHQAIVAKVQTNANSVFQGFDSSGSAVFVATGAGNLTITGTLSQGSDISLKENIKPLNNQLETVKKLNPVTFDWKEDKKSYQQIGFIAQEVEKHLPELIENKDDIKRMSYGNMTAVLVKAIQEQQEQIEALQSEINTLKGGD